MVQENQVLLMQTHMHYLVNITRKNPKSLIRRGTNQGYAKIEFSIRDKQYEAFRKIKNISSNYLEAKFFETTDNNRIDIGIR